MVHIIMEKGKFGNEKSPGEIGFNNEIERKFLVKSLPENLEQYPCEEIVQGYLVISEDGSEIRLRKQGDKYFQTFKRGSGKARQEKEVEITKDQFASLWDLTEDKRVEKMKYQIPYENSIIELDIYSGSLEGLASAEVEFESLQKSNQFEPPDWFGRDVTDDNRFKNQKLALYGIPDDY